LTVNALLRGDGARWPDGCGVIVTLVVPFGTPDGGDGNDGNGTNASLQAVPATAAAPAGCVTVIDGARDLCVWFNPRHHQPLGDAAEYPLRSTALAVRWLCDGCLRYVPLATDRADAACPRCGLPFGPTRNGPPVIVNLRIRRAPTSTVAPSRRPTV
jgi:hypothetical protein